jgi:hypothetical protein
MVDAAWLKPPEKLSAREPQFAHFSDRFIARTDPAAGAKRLKSADAVLLFSLLFLAIPGCSVTQNGLGLRSVSWKCYHYQNHL